MRAVSCLIGGWSEAVSKISCLSSIFKFDFVNDGVKNLTKNVNKKLHTCEEGWGAPQNFFLAFIDEL